MRKNNMLVRILGGSLLALSVVLLGACKKPKYHQLSEEDLLWIHYGESDSIHFVTNAGAKMTFYAFNLLRFYFEDDKNYREASTIAIKLREATTPDRGEISVQKTSGGATLAKLTWPHFNNTIDLTATPMVTDTVYGKIYHDLYIINSLNSTNFKFFETIFYSKSAGMIRMVDRYGYVWKNLDI